MGSSKKYNIGDKVKASGPRGIRVDGILLGIVIGLATFEDWRDQLPTPNMPRTEEEYRKDYFYKVSVD